jgi:nitric oxide reductase NorD protein
MRRARLLARPRRWLLKARHRAGTRLDALRGRVTRRRDVGDRIVPLEQVHRRLELFLTALYGRPMAIAPLEDAHSRSIVRRALARVGLHGPPPMASCSGEAILLPPSLAFRDDRAVLTRYRLLALEQAERMVRGTAEFPVPSDALERDLFLLREGATIDARIARVHGMAGVLSCERREAAAHRPRLERLTDVERAVELRVRALLTSRPDDVEDASPDPAASLAWARETARSIRASGAPYRGLPLAAIWGEPPRATTARSTPREERKEERELDELRARPRQSHDAAAHEAAVQPAESPNEQQQSRSAEQREASEPHDERDDAEPETADEQNEGTLSEQRARNVVATPTDELPPPTYYDEWDVEHGRYVRRAVAVRVRQASGDDPAWTRHTILHHAAIVRRVRHQFERLRARRSLLRRQRAGAELDVDAYVEAAVDRRAGGSLDDRLYIDVRPARRGLAIALLIDASASTQLRLNDSHRVIDLERVALFLASEALDALGDRYAIYSFGGQGASNVSLSVIKSFDESNGPSVHGRIGSIEPNGFTRLGAAIRHVTAQLAAQTAGHRLLLLLSDGRPHDVDHYQDRYAVEDARQAVLEARASGVFPYCLAVDADAAAYLPRLFGEAGHCILRRPEQLSKALIAVVNALLARAR